MFIAIISDVHDNLANLDKVLNYCKKNKIKEIICCGDLASLETLDYLNDNFFGKIYFVFGNMDKDYFKEKFISFQKEPILYKQTSIFLKQGKISLDNQKIAFTHFPQKAQSLCLSKKYDFVFYGHTHKPWQEKKDNCILLNPGNVANQIYPPSFALWNTENNNFQLVKINSL